MFRSLLSSLHIWTPHCILIGLVVSVYGSSLPTRLCLCLYVGFLHHESHHHHSPSSSRARTRLCLHHYFDHHHQQFPLRSRMHTYPYRRRYRISIVYCIYNTSSIRRRQSHPYLHHHWAPIHLHPAKFAFVFPFSSEFFIRIRSFFHIVFLAHMQDPDPSASLHSKGPYALRSHRRTHFLIGPPSHHLEATVGLPLHLSLLGAGVEQQGGRGPPA